MTEVLLQTLQGIKRIITIFMLFFIALSISAQVTLRGKVTNTKGKVMDCAGVVVMNPDSPKKIIASTFTDENGQYQLVVRSDRDSLTLRVSQIGIEPFVINIPNRSGEYNVIADTKAIELREAVVKAKKVYSQGDTINYNVSSFLSQSDQSIADVLKKMPGITVQTNGQVLYQGKPIKNFYIEGLDMMKGHYGIATNNIDPRNVSRVQVLENHQDIKALKGLRPEEQASINIRLKEGVKGLFNLIMTLGGGYGDNALWNNTAIATYFKRNSQLLTTYKGNNVGEDLSQELYSFDDDYAHTRTISAITMPSAPGIEKRFYYFNRSHSVTFNNIYRIGHSGEWGINAAYLHDNDKRSSWSSMSNTLPDGNQNLVEEKMLGRAKMQKAYGDLSYQNNSEQSYLKEQLKFDWNRTNYNSLTTAGSSVIEQKGKEESYRLLNKFHLTQRCSEYRGFEISSLVNLEKRPHHLSVSPNLIPELITGKQLYQQVDYNNISTENHLRLLSAWRIGNIHVTPSAVINLQHDGLNSTLASFTNDIKLTMFKAGIGTELFYSMPKLHASLLLPINYIFFHLNNIAADLKSTKLRLRIEPHVNITYDINSSHLLMLKSELSYSSPTIETLYTNNILTSYRQLSAYDVTGLFEGINQYMSVGYSFKNILSMSFAGVDLSWIHQRPDVLYGSYYDGISERTINQRSYEKANTFIVKAYASQGFDWKKLKIGVSASYTHYNNPLLVQNTVLRYTGRTLSTNADVSLSPTKWLTAAWKGSYYQMSSRQKGFQRQPELRTMSNNLTLDFTLPAGVALTSSLYHYYNNFNNGNRSFVLVNTETKYTFKRFSFTLSCDNLLNHNVYSYSNLSALSESKATYNIRPRSFLLKIRYRII